MTLPDLHQGDPSAEQAPPVTHTLVAQFRRALADGKIEQACAIQRQLWNADPALVARVPREIPLLAWDKDFAPAQDKRFLFVSGTPRSGTTALGRLINSHPDVALFTELFSEVYGYLPALFNPENIVSLHERGILPSFNIHSNSSMIEKANNAAVVGDKRPNFVKSAELTLANFAGRDTKVVHILRDPREVAFSYLQRVVNKSWHASRDHTTAVDEMNLNNRTMLKIVEEMRPGHSLTVIDYRTFWSSPANAESLFGKLDMDIALVEPEVIGRYWKDAASIAKRDRSLPADVAQYLDSHYDFEAHDRLLAMSQD